MQRLRPRLHTIFACVVLASLGTFLYISNHLISPSQSEGTLPNFHGQPVSTATAKPEKDINHIIAQFEKSEHRNGIIIFIHVVKCGGTSIRDNFGNNTLFPTVNYCTVFSLKQFRRAQKSINEKLDGSKQDDTVLFVEIHGHNTPTLLDLEPTLREWRQKAKANHIPFFAFTILREPLELEVSFFNFFHVYGDKRFQQMKASLDNFRETIQWNPQCLYLYKGERPYFRPDKFYNVTKADCEWVAKALEELMDWIGDTKRMSTDTLPLLTRLVSSDPAKANLLKPANVAETRKQKNAPFANEQLDQFTIDLVKRMTMLDQRLYLQAVSKNDFSLS